MHPSAQCPVPSAQCPVPSERITRSPLLTQPLRSLLCITAFYTITLLPLQAENTIKFPAEGITDGLLTYTDDLGETWKIHGPSAENVYVYYGPYDANKIGKNLTAEISFGLEDKYTLKSPSQIPIKVSPVEINSGTQKLTFTLEKKPEDPTGEKQSNEKPKTITKELTVMASFGGPASNTAKIKGRPNLLNDLNKAKNGILVQLETKEIELEKQISNKLDSLKKQNPTYEWRTVNSLLDEAKTIITNSSGIVTNQIKESFANQISDMIAELNNFYTDAETEILFESLYSPRKRQWSACTATYSGSIKSTKIFKLRAKLPIMLKAAPLGVGADMEISIAIEIGISYSNSLEPKMMTATTLDDTSPSTSFSIRPNCVISITSGGSYETLVSFTIEYGEIQNTLLESCESELQAGHTKK